MTSFLLSRASSNFPRFKLPLTTPKFHNKVKNTYQDARARQPPPDARRKSRPRRATTTRRSSTCSATRAGLARVLVFFCPSVAPPHPVRVRARRCSSPPTGKSGSW